jgi:hypothetical protein
MKLAADWIRTFTPEWTDEERYTWLSRIHSWLIPACLLGFIFINNWFLRFVILILQVIAIITEFYFRDCLITMIEKEFSQTSWDDIAKRIFKLFGWELSRPEKMTFNIGINIGVLLVFILMLLRESILWVVGISSIVVTALPSLMLFSRMVHHTPSVVPSLPTIPVTLSP